MISIKDIYWIAGFLEGEGSFGAGYRPCVVTATQVEKEPIERLHSLLGGVIDTYSRKAVTGNIYYRWRLQSIRAISLMMTLYSLMSPKRKRQIAFQIKTWKSSAGRGWQRHKTTCPLGHPYSLENTYKDPHEHRRCRTCARLRRGMNTKGVTSTSLSPGRESPPQ